MASKNNHNDFRHLDKSLRMQKIIDTAVDLFHKKGYRATTLDDVSKEQGITKAALYHYVSSKEHLLSIIYIQALENIFKNTTGIVRKDLPPDEKMRLLIRNHVKDIIIKSLSMFSVFFTEENQLSEKDFRKINNEKKKYNQIFEKIIEEGISLGIFKKTDPKLQAFGILGMCNWIFKWYKEEHTPYTPEQVADQFIELLESGYLNKSHDNTQADLPSSEPTGKKTRRTVSDKPLKSLKTQCKKLITLIEQLENSD